MVIEGKEKNIYLFGKIWNGKIYDLKDNTIISEIKNGSGFIKEYNYYNKNLIFEGEFVNGVRNGMGKEYDYNHELVFEGEYLNGDKWKGKGKEYSSNRDLLFEGNYLNGKKWNGKFFDEKNKITYELKEGNGFVKEYDQYKKIVFEGELSNGQKLKGKEYDYYDGYILFEGEYLNGQRWNGKGMDLNKCSVIIYVNGDTIEF